MANVGISTLTSTDIHDVTTDKHGTLGQIAMTADGRKYRYAKNSATALAAGVGIKKGTVADVTGTTKAAYKPADRLVDAGATVTAANAPKYEDGIAEINKAKYLVGGISTSGVVSLVEALDAPVAKGAAVKVSANQFSDVVVVANANEAIATTEVAVPANAYFWALVSQ